jgi:hypothetical protein
MPRDSFDDLLIEADRLVDTLNSNLRGDAEDLDDMPSFELRSLGGDPAIFWGDMQLWVLDNDGSITDCREVLKHRVDKVLKRCRELTAEQLFSG